MLLKIKCRSCPRDVTTIPSGATRDSDDRSTGPSTVVSADPNADVISIAITIIFECCAATRLSNGDGVSHNESVATRTSTAWKHNFVNAIESENDHELTQNVLKSDSNILKSIKMLMSHCLLNL